MGVTVAKPTETLWNALRDPAGCPINAQCKGICSRR